MMHIPFDWKETDSLGIIANEGKVYESFITLIG